MEGPSALRFSKRAVAMANAMDIGDYHSAKSPDAPIMVQMIRTPAQPGLPER